MGRIQLTRSFIQTTEFTKNWERMGLNDDDLRRLELEILRNPQVGPIVPGTGKLRKMRFAFFDRGKRGSTRVCYVDFVFYETVYLITVYPKNEKDDLTMTERNTIRNAICILERSLQGGKRHE